ncbi:TSUP family transporter [Intestinimonas butyriciproducens]|uniref:TSUP family transporter n=1 Tax=Intestinimonas butyriciproducens TaxID=1297617 RepID=UPI001A9BE498
MDLVLIAAIALLGGTIQTVIGFGGGIVIMMILPFFLDMLHASAVSSASLLFLNYSLAFRFRSSISFRRLPLPLLIYIPCSAFAIFLAASLDLEVLVLVFGVFLIVLALYFMFADGRFTVRDSIPAAVVCSAISGLSSGLFGIGGPLMSVYFLSNSKSKEEYTGTIQLFLPAPPPSTC